MSTITDSDLLTRFSKLPDRVKAEVVEFIDQRLDEKEVVPQGKVREAGWATKLGYTMVMSDDFDEPLELLC